MKKNQIFRVLVGSLLFACCASLSEAQDLSKYYEENSVLNYSDGEKAAGEIPQPTQFDPNFHIYLCFGQSNMEGNAKIESQDRQGISTRFKMMSCVDMPKIGREQGKWYAAVPPLCREWTGLTPADYFGRTLIANLPEEVKVGIVHVAVGGASINLFDEDKTEEVIANSADWFKNFCKDYGNNPYRRLIECAKEAQKVGVIKGILLHQGCTDNNQQDWPQRVNKIYQRMLNELNLKAEDVPLLVGELLNQEDGGGCYLHNAIIDRIHEEIPTAYAVSSLGCPGNHRDPWHFSAEGYRIIGRRYAEVMLGLLRGETEKEYVSQSRTVEDGGTGEYKAMMFEAKNLPAHTVFCPRNLDAFSAQKPLPVVVWGNGACTNSPWEHYLFLNEVASHGYLVVATGYFPVDDTPYKGEMSTTQQQIESIEWIQKENLNPNSPLYHKIDTRAICAAGMSCGGLQTLYNCADSRIKTYMICNSGLFKDPSIAVPNMPMPTKDKLESVHGPILYMLGGTEDIAYENGMDDFHRIQHVPALAINYPVGHGGTYRQPHGGEFSIPAVAWLDWQLKGSIEAASFLKGSNGLKKRQGWTVEMNDLAETALPNPLVFEDGQRRVKTVADWNERRREIAQLIQDYEIGAIPEVKREQVSARMDGDTLFVTVTVGENSLTLSSVITYPTVGKAPYALMIGSSHNSLPAEIFANRPIARMDYHERQVNGYSQFRGDTCRANYGFVKLYPELIGNGAYSEWAWGFQRLIDGLEILGPKVTKIDTKRIGVTGCSYAGKMALFCGAFDNRVALTIAQEPGGGGAAAWRVSHTLDGVENLDKTDYHWFKESLRDKFHGDRVNLLPYDHHELCALVCPRAFLMLGNTDYKWLADESGYVSVMAAKRVWETLGIADKAGLSILGGHNHCQLHPDQYPEVEAFIDKFLLKKKVNTSDIAIAPDFKNKVDLARWINF